MLLPRACFVGGKKDRHWRRYNSLSNRRNSQFSTFNVCRIELVRSFQFSAPDLLIFFSFFLEIDFLIKGILASILDCTFKVIHRAEVTSRVDDLQIILRRRNNCKLSRKSIFNFAEKKRKIEIKDFESWMLIFSRDRNVENREWSEFNSQRPCT